MRNGTPGTQQKNGPPGQLKGTKVRSNGAGAAEGEKRMEKPPSKDGAAQMAAAATEGLKDYVGHSFVFLWEAGRVQ